MDAPAAQDHMVRQVSPFRNILLAAVFIEFIANLEADGAGQFRAFHQGDYLRVVGDKLAEEHGELVGSGVELAGVRTVGMS